MLKIRLGKNKTFALIMGMSLCKYKSHVEGRIPTIIAWKRKGLTNAEVFENLGVGDTAMAKYRREHPELELALKNGKSDADAQVENALFRSALGYEVTETETVTVTDDEGTETVRTKTTINHVKGNVASMIFYLKNRLSAEWQDRKNGYNDDAGDKPLENNVHFLLPDNGMDDGDEKKKQAS